MRGPTPTVVGVAARPVMRVHYTDLAHVGLRIQVLQRCHDNLARYRGGTWHTPIDHPLDTPGHGGDTSGKGESQISVAVNNRPEAVDPLPVQYETYCGLLRLTVYL